MFSVFVRSVSRPLVSRPARCLSSKPPQPPTQTQGDPEPPTNDAPSPPVLSSSSSSSSTSMIPSLDFAGLKPEPEMERTGARSSKDTLTTSDRRRQMWSRMFMGLVLGGLGATTAYMGREWTEDELKWKKMRIEDAPSTRAGRTKERFTDLFDYFNKPLWTELLPPPLPQPHQRPYTLLLSIDDLLVTSTWDRQQGWRTAKRPGVDYFLAYLSQFYEIVIFTTQHYYTAMPILDKLDRYNFFISYQLFREATRSINGKIVKDLSYLNRDLSKVVCLDTVPDHVSTHPENSIIIPKWNGDPHDKGLVAMIPFLESIGIYKPPDVRPILDAYRGKNIPLEYAKKEAEAKQRHVEEWRSGKTALSVGGISMTSLFGRKNSDLSSVPPTYLEQKRKEAQKHYLEDQAFLRAHKEEYERTIEQNQKAMVKEAPNTMLAAIQAMQGVKPRSEGAAEPEKNAESSEKPPS